MDISSVSKGFSELKGRLLFLVGALIVYRIGAHIPVPGIDPGKLKELLSSVNSSILGLFNLFSGGSLSRLTIFALGIMPYISASIIVQLLSTVVPALEQLKKEGNSGKRKITQYTRYLTLVLCTVQAIGIAKYLSASGATFLNPSMFYPIAVVSLLTGTMFLMWLGEQITERGIGNGISMIIFAGIVTGLPASVFNTLDKVRSGEIQAIGFILLCACLIAVTCFIVFMERAQRRITVHYAKAQGGRFMSTQKTHLPLKINMAGVIPPIFASSIILFPATLGQWFGSSTRFSFLQDIGMALSPGKPLYLLLLASAIMFFAFFYTALVYNPKDTADNLKKSGAYIPGIRPGEQTSNYIDKIITRLTLVGGLYIAAVALLPEFLVYGWNVPFYFGGTSLLIVVVVVMDFIAQVQAQLMSYQYEGLLKKANLKGFK